jgi:hypothetical protein
MQVISSYLFGDDLLYNFIITNGFEQGSLIYPMNFDGNLFLIRTYSYLNHNIIKI